MGSIPTRFIAVGTGNSTVNVGRELHTNYSPKMLASVLDCDLNVVSKNSHLLQLLNQSIFSPSIFHNGSVKTLYITS